MKEYDRRRISRHRGSGGW